MTTAQIKPSPLTRAEVLEKLDYRDGVFLWKVPHQRVKVSVIAGSIVRNRERLYRKISINGRTYAEHRLVWLIEYGYWPEFLIDHIDGNGLNNKPSNLRRTSDSLNMQNQKRAQRGNKTGLLGVHPNRHKYVAQIDVNGKHLYLGIFTSAQEAHAAYIEAKRRLHPANTL